MLLISAYPCLGKTTISNLNDKAKVFDRDFNETRSRLGMNKSQIAAFHNACCDIIQLQYEANYHDVLFITDDEAFLSNLKKRGIKPILVFPNGFDDKYIEEYKGKVIARSGEAWWNRVMVNDMHSLKERIMLYKNDGYDIRLTDSKHPYIEDVILFPPNIITPKYIHKQLPTIKDFETNLRESGNFELAELLHKKSNRL